jgi:glycosyltransferase involved in cell wall biosynthesis
MNSVEDISFSIIIPSYNCGDYIGATIYSVLQQEYKRLEIVIMDGGSTDATSDIVSAIDDPRIKFNTASDEGQLDAVLKGIDLASGDVLHWLNADDIMLPNSLSHVAALFNDYANVDLIYADSFNFDETLCKLYVSPLIRGLTDYEHLLFYKQFYSECVYWRSALKADVPREQRGFRLYTDYAFFLRLKWGRKILWTPKRLGAFRIRHGQMSQLRRDRAVFEYETIRGALRSELGFSPLTFKFIRWAIYPRFVLLRQALPALAAANRAIYRKISGDRDRQDIADLFFAWIRRSQTRLRVM